MKGCIELTGMRFHAFHGCLPEERRDGGEYLVDFRCGLDISKAAGSDSLEDTLDYSEIYRIAAAQMAVPSNLLEHVAARIADAIAAAFPGLEGFEIKVSKLAPPVGGPCDAASVTVSR